MEAVRSKAGAANVNDSIRNGKHSYYIKLGELTWEIEPQVILDAEQGVKVKSKPDFVFWPIAAPDHLPVAVFTDGFTYHKDNVADDTLKREAIRRSGKFRVWSLSFKDVQDVFASQGDYATITLDPNKMPSGTRMYSGTVKKESAEDLDPNKLGAFDLMMAYLSMPNAEQLFRTHAYAYALSLLEPALMKNSLAYSKWSEITERIKEQAHFTKSEFTFPGTAFGTWIPRSNDAHLAVYAGILPNQLKSGGPVAVCAVLDDDKARRSDRYESEWNGAWQFANMMQFGKEFIAVSRTGLDQAVYLSLPHETQEIELEKAVSSETGQTNENAAWATIMELLFDEETKAFAQSASEAGIPAPEEENIGYDVDGADGQVYATIEIAWPDRKIGFLTTEQMPDRETLEQDGWTIIDMLTLREAVQLFLSKQPLSV